MTVSQLKSFHSFCSQSARPPPESHRDLDGLGQGALLLARAVLAAAALPLLGAASGMRPALAVHVPTCSLQYNA